MDSAPDAVLLYDGLCGFCDWAVQFVLARDVTGTLRFAPLQGKLAHEILARRAALGACDSLMFVRHAGRADERVTTRSDAIVALWHYLGGVWSVGAWALRVIPAPVRDVAYDLFARHRHRMFGRRAECRAPTEAQRARFIP